MGQVTIFFNGICTHLRNPPITSLPAPHRVVLVDAVTARTVSGITIPAHTPTITVSELVSGEPPQSPLNGVRFIIGNASGELSYVNYEQIMPSIANEMNMVTTIPSVNGAALELVPPPIDPPYVAFFDLFNGLFTAFIDDMGAVSAMVVINTTGDTVELLAQSMTDPAMSFVLKSPATIRIGNSSMDEHDSRSHFLLHYLAGESIPPAPQVPTSPAGPMPPTIGAGCSNSGYP